jgi:cell division protein FtsI (penicillin-binding protein 3)
MLEGVVSKGLGKQAGSPQFHVSGKTGTAQVAQGAGGYKGGTMQYLVSFCGYFPSEDPKYSCIVAIRKPGYPASGGGMAGPVFSRIAERVMAGSLKRDIAEAIDSNSVVIPDVKNGNLNEARYILRELDVDNEWEGHYEKEDAYGKTSMIPDGVKLTRMELKDGVVPDVRGMGAKDAVYLMEKGGLKVQLSGIGKVRSQSIPAGNRLVKGQTVRLVLR